MADDADCDQARALFYGGFDHRPEAIVWPTDTSEVAQVVSLAAERGLELAVRGGGHSSAGHSVCDGGMVLDLSELKALEIDTAQRTRRIGAGNRSRRGDVRALPHRSLHARSPVRRLRHAPSAGRRPRTRSA